MTSTVAPSVVAARGHDAARLFEQYGDQLYRYCLARLRSREEAEDALQNTFLRVYAALERGTTPRFEAAWLYKIAHNVCLSRREVTGRRALHEASADIDELPLAAPETHSDELFGLSEALTSMPKNLRDPILLREWQGLSYEEIANSLDTSVSAVETLIFRARRHLAAALEPTKVPKRSLARLLDAGWLYGAARIALARLEGVLGAAGAAKLAAGAAVLAIGGTAVSVEVTAADTKRSTDRVPSPFAASKAVNASFVAHVTTAPVFTGTARHTATTAAAPKPTASSAAPAGTSTAPAAAPAPTPTTTTAQPAPAPAAPAAPTPASPPAVAPPVAVAPLPAPGVPAPPAVGAPTIEVPPLVAPAIAPPAAVQPPAVTTPASPVTVTLPG